MINNKIKIGLASIIAMLPIVSAYPSGFPLPNLWDIFVESMFGAFWPAVIFLVILFSILLALGGISYYTVLIFDAYFVYAMALGYGYSILVMPILVVSLIYPIWQTFKWIMENR